MSLTTSIDFTNTKLAYAYKSIKDLRLSLFLYKLLNNQWLGAIGKSLLKFSIKVNLPVKPIIEATLYKQFVGGESLLKCVPLMEKLNQHNVMTILDYSDEGSELEDDFVKAYDELEKNIIFSSQYPFTSITVFKISAIGSTNILTKVSEKKELNEQEKAAWELIKLRFHLLCKTAYEYKVTLMIDAEESWFQDTIDNLALEQMLIYNKDRAVIMNTYQLYRHASLENLKNHHQYVNSKGFYFGAKLVRGAYMEKERLRAKQYGYQDPIQPNKESTDKDYNAAVDYCLQNNVTIKTVIGTHNEYSCMRGIENMLQLNLEVNHPHVWFSQLYGMCDHISFNLAAQGYNVVKYVPYGPVKTVVPYLLRRADENSSIDGQAKLEIENLQKEIKRRQKNIN